MFGAWHAVHFHKTKLNTPFPHKLPPQLIMAAFCSKSTGMKMAQTTFKFRNVEIDKANPLGGGAHIAVYRAMCDGLPCAAKMLHPILFEFNLNFEKHIEISLCCQHPNIVQYLGTTTDSETGQPVLLMELMDGNLTQYLEHSQESLPYHIQVNICHDIAQALNYLHSNDIIHCNVINILLSGDKAKLSTSMCSVLPVEEYHACPGTPCYMPPEGFGGPYTCKLDCFSFGVLAIQIITRQFPDPGPRSQSEIERRRSHIDLINPKHPLLPIVLECLKDRDTERPSSQEICRCLAALKEGRQYTDSVQRGSAAQRQLVQANQELHENSRQLKQANQELEQENQELEEANQALGQAHQELEEANQALGQENQALGQAHQELEEANQELEEANQALGQENQALGQAHQELEEANQALGQENQALGQENQALGQAHQELEEANQALGQENQALGQENQALGQAHQELEEANQALGQENQALGQENQALGQAHQELEEANQALGQENQALGQENQALGQAHQELEEANQALGQKNQALGQENQALGQAHQELGHANQELQEKDQQLEQAIESQRSTQRQLEQANEEVQSLSRQLQQLRVAQPQLPSTDITPWTVPHTEVEILDEIGRGGWGAVARGTFHNQQVAVKSLHPAIINTQTLERLRREVRIMAHVRHPNLLRFIAAVFDDQTPPLIITELLNMNLRTAYENGHLQSANKLPIFCDVAYALHYLHEHEEPIIHRDVSAPNVLLEALPGGTWRAKISDFGSANVARLARTLGEGAIIYSAPETFPNTEPHARPLPQTTKIDIYSYGILLCEVVTCQFPDPAQYHDMLQQVQINWQFMYDLIVLCTKRNPDERPTMLQVVDELNKLPRPRPQQ